MTQLISNKSKILSNEEAREYYHSKKLPKLCHTKDFVNLTGSIKAAIFLTQIIYWDNVMSKRHNSGKFYKTDCDWEEELNINRATLKRLRAKLKGLGYISIQREGNNGINHYIVNWSKLTLDLCNIRDGSKCTNSSKIDQMSQPDGSKCTNRMAQNEPSLIIHKNTHKNTHHHPQNVSSSPNAHHKRIAKNDDEDSIKIFYENFEHLWKCHPKKENKLKAREAFMAVMKKGGVDFDTIIEACKNYAKHVEGKEYQFIQSLENWIKQEKWTDVYPPNLKQKSSNAIPIDPIALKEQILDSMSHIVGLEKEVRLKILQSMTPYEYKSWFNDMDISIKDDRIELTFYSRFLKDQAEIAYRFRIEPGIASIHALKDKWISFKLSDKSMMNQRMLA